MIGEPNPKPTLLLASSSPRRRELIRFLQLPVEILVNDVDETVEEGLTPAQIVETLSERKASASLGAAKEENKDGILIGSDTIVVVDGMVLGKPQDQADAARMLGLLQGRSHQVYTGLCCIDTESGRTIISHTVNNVTFRAMNEKEIAGYIQTGEPMDKAGSYGVQGLGSIFIERIDGDFYSVMGLPLNLLYQLLLELEVSPF